MAHVIDNMEDVRVNGDKRSGRKRKWTVELDVILLREVKVHEPRRKSYGRIGDAHEGIARSLNQSRRLPWTTDRRHVQYRLQFLMAWRSKTFSEPAEAGESDDEGHYSERLQLLDEIMNEADEFKQAEEARRGSLRERERFDPHRGRGRHPPPGYATAISSGRFG
jgi:hypothetical protein